MGALMRAHPGINHVAAVAGIDAERVEAAPASERVGELAIERERLQLRPSAAFGVLRLAVDVEGVDDPAFAVGRERDDLDPDAAHLHVGGRDEDQAARRHMAARETFLAALHQPHMVRRVALHLVR